MNMKHKRSRKSTVAIRTDGSLRITVDDVRDYFARNTWTHADTMKFLHRVGLRIRKDGSTYVVPI